MKGLLFFFMCVLHYSIAVAQPTLTGATTNPVAGDSYKLYSCDATGITHGASGANVTWDFTSLTIQDSSVTKTYVTASGTPNGSQYTSSNIAQGGYNGGYLYFIADGSKYSYTGLYFPSLYNTNCSDPMDYLRYPFTYNSNFTDSYVENKTGSSIVQTKGSTVVTADAYGTLKLPYGTFTNVLRVHRANTYTDSVSSSPLTNNKADVYNWFVTGVHHPLLEVAIYETPVGSTPLVVVGYIKQSPTSVNAVTKTEDAIKLFPNPSNGQFTLKVNSNTSVGKATVTNVYGRVVKEIQIVGNQEIEINLEHPSGIYFVTVSVNGVRQVKKITVSN